MSCNDYIICLEDFISKVTLRDDLTFFIVKLTYIYVKV